MNIEVDTEELKYCEEKLSTSSNNLSDEIDYWENQIDQLKSIWSGTEANVFYTKMEEYLIKLRMLSETTSMFSNTVKNCYVSYETNDDNFAGKIKEENSKYDDEAFLNDPRNQELLENEVI